MHITINPVIHKKLVVQIQWQNFTSKTSKWSMGLLPRKCQVEYLRSQGVNPVEKNKLSIPGVKE